MTSGILLTRQLRQGINHIRKMSQEVKNVSQQMNLYKTIAITVPKPFVYHVQLNRPNLMNAMDDTLWNEFGACFEELAENPDCRAIVLSGSGKAFCAGLDLKSAMILGQELAEHEDIARKSKILLKKIKSYQDSMTSVEKCPKPVIAAVHGPCIGAGVEIISAADIRYCSTDAWYQIKEVDLGMAADVGSLQRFPKIVGNQSLVRELIFTARKFTADEALQCGFVNRVYKDYQQLIDESTKVAEIIAGKSPVAVQGSKKSLIFSRDHSVQEGLDQIATHNQAMMQSEDFLNSAIALATKGDPPVYSKL